MEGGARPSFAKHEQCRLMYVHLGTGFNTDVAAWQAGPDI